MIPKIIIQTYKSKSSLSGDAKEFVKKIKKLHPDYNIMYFTDEDIDDFMKTNFPQYLEKFNSFKYKIQKIDFFRYLAIYFYGGFYFDVDVELTKKLDELLGFKCIFPVEFDLNTIVHFLSGMQIPDIKKYSGIQTLTEQLGQYAFGAEKGSPFLKQLIDNIVMDLIPDENIPENNKEEYVCCRTGPRIVTLTYFKYINKNEVYCLKPRGQMQNMVFGDYGKHWHQGSWKNHSE